ncbi:hypothetical protein MRX96_033663 [Rhipicephalus microplus]
MGAAATIENAGARAAFHQNHAESRLRRSFSTQPRMSLRVLIVFLAVAATVVAEDLHRDNGTVVAEDHHRSDEKTNHGAMGHVSSMAHSLGQNFNMGRLSGSNAGKGDHQTIGVRNRRSRSAAATSSPTPRLSSAAPHTLQKDSSFRQCQVSVQTAPGACQLRLDFTKFQLSPPVTCGPQAGMCVDDAFSVSAGLEASTYPILCGFNSGQHMYVDVSQSKQAILTVRLSARAERDRKWEIHITQVSCWSPNMAPTGCLQYHTKASDFITSFNFVRNPTGFHYFANMHYSICIRRQLGFCSYPGELYFPNQYEENGPNGFRLSPLVNQRCSDAYVLIPTGSTGSVRDGNLGDRICGTTFTPVAANVTPFRLSFITGPRVGYSDCPCPGVRPNTPVRPNPSTVIVNPPQVQPNPPQVQPNPAVVVNPPVVQPNPAVVVNPPVVQPNPAVVVNPPVVQPNPAVVVNPPVVQPNPTVVVNPPVVQPNPAVVVNPSPQVLPTQPQLPIGSQLPAGLGSTAANVTQFAGREFTERQFADALVCRAGGFSLKYTQLPYGC